MKHERVLSTFRVFQSFYKAAKVRFDNEPEFKATAHQEVCHVFSETLL